MLAICLCFVQTMKLTLWTNIHLKIANSFDVLNQKYETLNRAKTVQALFDGPTERRKGGFVWCIVAAC